MNRATFFAAASSTLFDGHLNDGQVQGIEAIIDGWNSTSLTDLRWLAYMLATAFHETAKTMQPVIETRQPGEDKNPSVDRAIARLDSAFKAGRLSWVTSPYWRKDADGKSWLGRGLVQLTHKANYVEMSAETGVDLVAQPDRAMEMDVAVKIMMVGMTKGSFTTKKLADYFSPAREDWFKARKIINGTDRAELVAGHGREFLAAIKSAL